MKMTKIICTLGPAVDDELKLNDLIDAGMDVARFNFSHGDHVAQKERVDRVKRVRENNGKNIALLLDTKGPEIRIGKIKNDKVFISNGNNFILYNNDTLGDEKGASITHKDLYKTIEIGKTILINDGLIELEVESIDNKDIICKIINGGVISNNKGINIPDTDTKLPSLTEQDVKDIKFAVENDFDFIAASFIRKAKDVLSVRDILDKNNASHIKIISKIENREGVDNFDEILEASDGIMVARGDLGVEIPFEEIPALQKIMCKKCNEKGKIVIVATQMLESMIVNPRPTRAEVSDVANAIYDGATSIMLSGESAAGNYPVESVRIMRKIAEETERDIRLAEKNHGLKNYSSISDAISDIAILAADNINATALVCFTESGKVAIKTSFNKPNCPIVAITKEEKVQRALNLYYGVYPVLIDNSYNIQDMFKLGAEISLSRGFSEKGDTIVIISGENKIEKDSTNLLKIQKV